MRLLLLAAVLFLLFLTNPGPDEFEAFVDERVGEQIAAQNLPGGGILSELGGLAAGQLVRRYADRDNYLIFSVYTLDLDGRARDEQDWKFLGIATFFFELERPAALR